jgi:hypothetical protein
LLLGPLAACGSDKKDDSKTDVTTDNTTGTTKAGTGASGGNAKLTAFCTDVEKLAEDVQKAAASGSSGTEIASKFRSRGEALQAQAAQLMPSLSSADLPNLMACSGKMAALQSEYAKGFGASTG